jgi:tetratricopeptide (TPR) repeat protein
MDVEGILPGQNFAQTIEQILARCSHVLVVIGPHWREILDARAHRQDEDYVLHEVATALKQKKTVVPVFVGGAGPASLSALPDTLADLTFHQAMELRDASFNEDCDRLAKKLQLAPAFRGNLMLALPAAAVVLTLLILLAANAGFGPWRASHERKLQVAQLAATATAQVQQEEYQSGFESYQRILNLAPNDLAALDGQVDAAMLWLENFHVLTSEGQKTEEIAAPLLAQMKTVLEAGLARTNGKGTRAADILAHIGWLHWLNEKMAFKEFGNADRFFTQALAADPANVFAHAFFGNWLLQTNGDSAQALEHFRSALATNAHRDLVRRMQLGGLYGNNAPGMRSELLRALNQIRANHETLDKTYGKRLSYLYDTTVTEPAELHETLTAVSPEDEWETYLWINPDPPRDEYAAATRAFVHASLAEISGDRSAAAEFKTLATLLAQKHFNGNIARYTADAIRRLSR